jgi:hypothetical protein
MAAFASLVESRNVREDLFDRGLAGDGLADRVLEQRDEPLLAADLADLVGRTALEDRLADLLAEQQHLEHADAALVARAPAVRAAAPLAHVRTVEAARDVAEMPQVHGRRLVGLRAVIAHAP